MFNKIPNFLAAVIMFLCIIGGVYAIETVVLVNTSTLLTTLCIQNGTPGASGAFITIYNNSNAQYVSRIAQGAISTGLFGKNVTFNYTGLFHTVEECNFSGTLVAGGQDIVVSDNLNTPTVIVDNSGDSTIGLTPFLFGFLLWAFLFTLGLIFHRKHPIILFFAGLYGVVYSILIMVEFGLHDIGIGGLVLIPISLLLMWRSTKS